jgi:hypothetical protein
VNDKMERTFMFHGGRQGLGPMQPPVQWVSGPLSSGVKRQQREADNLAPYSADVKNA